MIIFRSPAALFVYPLPITLRAYSIIHPSHFFINSPPWLPIERIAAVSGDDYLLQTMICPFNPLTREL